MYEEHPACTSPPPNAILWRYMDFMKYVSLLDRKALFFTRIDKLGDPFEGSISETTIAMRPVLNPGLPGKDYELLSKQLSWHIEDNRKTTFVNCWHQNDIESDFMWKLYAREREGIAIVSNFESLSGSFTCGQSIYVGSIKYVDYNTEFIPERNLFSVCLHKRKSFEHEREVRALTSFRDEELGEEMYCDVDLSILIDKVVIAP